MSLADERNSYAGYSDGNIKQQVFELLDKNPLLTSKYICQLLGLRYEQHGQYVRNLRSQWKRNTIERRGVRSVCFHCRRGWVFVGGVLGLDFGDGGFLERIIRVGWRLSKAGARCRFAFWRDELGRMEWFTTGRVNLFVRKPGTIGHVYQLFCNGFVKTGLISDIRVVEALLKSIKLKGAHAVFDVGQKLPRLTIDLFQKSNGVRIKLGDLSHPTAVEVEFAYPDWAERSERLLERLTEVLGRLVEPAPSPVKFPDYVR
jgi:hypothetical protein